MTERLFYRSILFSSESFGALTNIGSFLCNFVSIYSFNLTKKAILSRLLANNLRFFALPPFSPLIDQGRSFFLDNVGNQSSDFFVSRSQQLLLRVDDECSCTSNPASVVSRAKAETTNSASSTAFFSEMHYFPRSQAQSVQSLWSTVKHFNLFVLQKFLNMGVNQSKGSVDITSTPNKGPAPEVNGKKADEKIIDEKTKVRFLFYFYTGCPNKF